MNGTDVASTRSEEKLPYETPTLDLLSVARGTETGGAVIADNDFDNGNS